MFVFTSSSVYDSSADTFVSLEEEAPILSDVSQRYRITKVLNSLLRKSISSSNKPDPHGQQSCDRHRVYR